MSLPSFFRLTFCACFWTCLLLGAGAGQAQAHAVRAAQLPEAGAVLIQFAYSTGEVPAYAAVEVYSPADQKVEFQNGRTDAQGRFAFAPDAPGLWRIVMADNMGHKLDHEVMVRQIGASGGNTADAAASGGNFSTPLRALLGVSLLLNLGLGAFALRKRRSARSPDATA